MKKLAQRLSILLLVVAGIGRTQITITAADITPRFAVGKKYTTFADYSTRQIGIGGTGPFGTVDFSTLVKTQEYISESVAASPYAANYPGATTVFKNNQLYNGVAATNYVHLSIASDVYHLHGTATESSLSGLAAVIKILFNPALINYKLPLTLNGANTQQVNQEIESTVMGFATRIVNQYKSSYLVDGYGKMRTPEGKLVDVLRIRLETTITTPQNVTTVSTSYGFLATTGEFVSVAAAAGQAQSGTVQAEVISWNDGDGPRGTTGVSDTGAGGPERLELAHNYPNPFNPSTLIRYRVAEAGPVRLTVYNARGENVATLVDGYQAAGEYVVPFMAQSALAAGVYHYSLQTGNVFWRGRMALVK